MKKESERPPISEGRPDVETPRKESITQRLYVVEKAHGCAVNADLWDGHGHGHGNGIFILATYPEGI